MYEPDAVIQGREAILAAYRDKTKRADGSR